LNSINKIFREFKSDLLKSGGEIPEGHYAADSMKATVVPGRNLIFASIVAGYAESIGATAIALGVHSGDHHIYPDCRPEFTSALELTLQASTEGMLSLLTPFMDMDKTSILKLGNSLEIKVPYVLTRTCYKDQKISCGKCGSCVERLEAFAEIKVTDPIKYETNGEI